MKVLRAEKRFGLEPGGYMRMLEEQGHKCAICAAPFDPERRLGVDHDHGCCDGRDSCGECVRGLLCGRCNLGLEQFRDDPSRLRSAADYLDRYHG